MSGNCRYDAYRIVVNEIHTIRKKKEQDAMATGVKASTFHSYVQGFNVKSHMSYTKGNKIPGPGKYSPPWT